MIETYHNNNIREVLACGTTIVIRNVPRKQVKTYLDRNGYRWDKDWELWVNDKDEPLRWGQTALGHSLYVA